MRHWMYIVTALWLLAAVTGHGEHKEHKDEEEYDPDFFDDDALHDEEHMKEHMEGVMDTKKNMTKEELEFIYFKEHDFDQNNKLDGLEILQTLRHSAHVPKIDETGKTPTAIMDEKKIAYDKQLEKITKAIDKILSDHDHDNDGYLSYSEYAWAKEHIEAEKKKGKHL